MSQGRGKQGGMSMFSRREILLIDGKKTCVLALTVKPFIVSVQLL
jgi:hypothetical protein